MSQFSKVSDIDRRTRIGSDAWKEHKPSAKRLSVWRRLHMLKPHEEVVKHVSADAPLADMLETLVKFQRER